MPQTLFDTYAQISMVKIVCIYLFQRVPSLHCSWRSCSHWTGRQGPQTPHRQTWSALCILQVERVWQTEWLEHHIYIVHVYAVLFNQLVGRTLNEIQCLVFRTCDVIISPGGWTTWLAVLNQQVRATYLEWRTDIGENKEWPTTTN